MSSMSERWGWLAEFESPEALLRAARATSTAGYRAEAYTPFPVDGLDEALGRPRPRIPAATLLGALLGAAAGALMQWYAATIALPLDIGGRPLNSWPMFVPVAFETGMLGGAFAAVAAMLWSARLPRLHHPLFETPAFELATRNRFFLAIPGDDAVVPGWLDGLQPLCRIEVPA